MISAPIIRSRLACAQCGGPVDLLDAGRPAYADHPHAGKLLCGDCFRRRT